MYRQTQDRETRHVWEFVETLFGPAIYLVFFGLLYLASSFACALSRGNAPLIGDAQTVVTASVVGLALTALLLIGWNLANGIRLLARGREDSEDSFMGLVTLTLAILSVVAVLWTALPIAMLPSTC